MSNEKTPRTDFVRRKYFANFDLSTETMDIYKLSDSLETELADAIRERDHYKEAIQNCLGWANGRQSEWGDRASNAFRFIEDAMENFPVVNVENPEVTQLRAVADGLAKCLIFRRDINRTALLNDEDEKALAAYEALKSGEVKP